MVKMTIELPEATAKKLNRIAATQGLNAEDFVSQAMKRLTAEMVVPRKGSEGTDEMDPIIDYVLKKNAELYRRLA